MPASTLPSGPATTGDVSQVVDAAPQALLAPAAIADPVEVTGAARVDVSSVERIDAEARLPGEIAGPALAVHVTITNTGSAPIDLAAVTVTLRDGSGAESAPLTSDPAAPLVGVLEAGARAEGTYLFEFGAERTEPITIEVNPVVEAPTAVFVGPIS